MKLLGNYIRDETKKFSFHIYNYMNTNNIATNDDWTNQQRKGAAKTTEAGEAKTHIRSDNSFDVLSDYGMEMAETNVKGHVSTPQGGNVNTEMIVNGHVSASQAEKDAEALLNAPKSPIKKKQKNTWFSMSDAAVVDNNDDFRNPSSKDINNSNSKKVSGNYSNDMDCTTINSGTDNDAEKIT
jgi:hypothetical protein